MRVCRERVCEGVLRFKITEQGGCVCDCAGRGCVCEGVQGECVWVC